MNLGDRVSKRDRSHPGMSRQMKTSAVQEKLSDTALGRRTVTGICNVAAIRSVEGQGNKVANSGNRGRIKKFHNDDDRKVPSKKELSSAQLNNAPKKQDAPISKNPNQPKLRVHDSTTSSDGRRPVLRMPANIPRANRKQRYVITVVGNEIKLLSQKSKGLKINSGYHPFAAHPEHRISSVMHKKRDRVPKPKNKKKKARGKNLIEKSKKEEAKHACKSQEGLSGTLGDFAGKMVIDLNCTDISNENPLKEQNDLRKFIHKFSDRRIKAIIPPNPVQTCMGDEILSERLDPISNILSTELIDSVKRCQSIIDFTTEPIENPNPPIIFKQIFYDSTMMEELDFPPMRTSALKEKIIIPEFSLVPVYLSQGTKKSLSHPSILMNSPKYMSPRCVAISLRKRKRKLKLETILATRPKGFQHAKWFEKTVAPGSTLKSKLLQDVIISQVKKCLKRQADLRKKLQVNSDVVDHNNYET